ncbi:hypothetical protein GPALN_007743 [Globodera pallida]|nr:hypothetical protein GPALN_007743 [Globodera pallida]
MPNNRQIKIIWLDLNLNIKLFSTVLSPKRWHNAICPAAFCEYIIFWHNVVCAKSFCKFFTVTTQHLNNPPLTFWWADAKNECVRRKRQSSKGKRDLFLVLLPNTLPPGVFGGIQK